MSTTYDTSKIDKIFGKIISRLQGQANNILPPGALKKLQPFKHKILQPYSRAR